MPNIRELWRDFGETLILPVKSTGYAATNVDYLDLTQDCLEMIPAH